MSDPRIAEISQKQAVLETHFKNQDSLLKSLESSTKELHESVREQQITIIGQSNTIQVAVDKMTAAIDRQSETTKQIGDINTRLLKTEEHIKRSEEFWKPIKSKFTMIIFGFLMAGVILAAVTAYNKAGL